jgi:hypothetical protein
LLPSERPLLKSLPAGHLMADTGLDLLKTLHAGRQSTAKLVKW